MRGCSAARHNVRTSARATVCQTGAALCGRFRGRRPRRGVIVAILLRAATSACLRPDRGVHRLGRRRGSGRRSAGSRPASGRTGSGRPARSWNWSVDPWMLLAVVILLPSRITIYAAAAGSSSIRRRFFFEYRHCSPRPDRRVDFERARAPAPDRIAPRHRPRSIPFDRSHARPVTARGPIAVGPHGEPTSSPCSAAGADAPAQSCPGPPQASLPVSQNGWQHAKASASHSVRARRTAGIQAVPTMSSPATPTPPCR
jgi:hypothetical protein